MDPGVDSEEAVPSNVIVATASGNEDDCSYSSQGSGTADDVTSDVYGMTAVGAVGVGGA